MLGSPWVLNSGPSPHLQDVDEAYMNKVELESRLEGLTDEINFLRQIHEEVLSRGLEWAGPPACQYPSRAPRQSIPVFQHATQQGPHSRSRQLTLLERLQALLEMGKWALRREITHYSRSSVAQPSRLVVPSKPLSLVFYAVFKASRP